MLFALIFALFITTILNLGAAQDNCAREYTVVTGDTCNGISTAQNVSTFQLAHVNTVIDAACDNLQVGQVLCLGIIGQDCNETVVVMSGDTCSSIAQANDIDLSILLVNNRNVNAACTNLLVDTVLCVASGIIPYT
ncbi:uncharacterized protein EV420DRAFT_1272111 [Desarmillaria tabescens]|uniref:LysM domain-containing protein n=1 Tax=Armillaria tabescens TaxID=1929756 RepID=A0AA39N2D8_ARMTA|nr:uncharacterized protein EV420DRAFT_1272111 [Desarmillaria tabescens]KAK0455686.1 hypothetical protein EV420DRAFT_1272111 [Desarmillaria tabescens]